MKKRDLFHLQQTYNEELLAACSSGDEEGVRLALRNGADPNYRSSLRTAVWHNRSAECVRLLLEAGADVNSCEYFDYDRWRYITVLDEMINHPFYEPVNRNSNLLSLSHEQFLSFPEENGAEFRAILRLMDSYGAVEAFYAEESENVSEPSQEVMQLLFAIRSQNVEEAENLLAQGVECQCYSNRGYSALALAARYGQLPMVELLLDYGAAVDADHCSSQLSVMCQAARSGNLELTRTLLPYVRHRQKRDELSLALFPAAARGRVDILQFLIDQGADVNHQYSGEYYPRRYDPLTLSCTLTPLIYTIINNQRAAHDLLIDHGATYTPLYIP